MFDHLGKTGGMAVTSWLNEALGSGTVTPDLTGNHSELVRRYGGLYPIISAHIIFDEILDPRYKYVTLLRDPVDRVISWLFYADNTVPDTPEFLKHKNGARDFIRSDGEIVSEDILSSISNYYVEHFNQIQRFSSGKFEGKVDAALQSLDDFSVIGLYEQFPSFLLEVAELVGLPAPESIARVNGTTERPRVNEITPALRQRIVELNQLDIRLYEEIAAQKQLAKSRDSKSGVAITVPQWAKYEPVRDRVMVTQDVSVIAAKMRNDGGIVHGQLVTFDVDFFLSRDVDDLELGIHVFDDDRRWAFGINSTLLRQCHKNLARGLYRASHHLIANLPAGKYTAGFAFTERLPEQSRDLAWYDKLCEFQVFHESTNPCVGYAQLPAEIALSCIAMTPENLIVDHAPGSIVVKTPVAQMLVGETLGMDVEIDNHGVHLWQGNGRQPIRLCYHWFNEDGAVAIFDGERSPLPEGGIATGQTIVANMNIVAPSVPGLYTLMPTLVQEGVGWLEEMGLETTAFSVVVVDRH